jgi:ParB family transcriptional regulator, chromosome partitioning protein
LSHTKEARVKTGSGTRVKKAAAAGGELVELPLSALVVGKGQVRTRNAGKEIDALADSIAKVGLLEPIIVCPGDKEGTYEILTGQRRFLAHKKLGKRTIAAIVHARPKDEVAAKVISLTENLIRLDPSRIDVIDAITMLYKRYSSASLVAEKTGIPYPKVLEYVKYDRLKPELKQLVDKGEVTIPVALRAQDAAMAGGGKYVAGDAIQLAKEMSSMSDVQRRRIVDVREDNPDKPVAEVIEDAKTGAKLTQINVTLGAEEHRALQSFAKESEINQDDAAQELILDGLTSRGYLGES